MKLNSVFDCSIITAEFQNAGINPHFIPLIWKYFPITLFSLFFVVIRNWNGMFLILSIIQVCFTEP